MQIYSSMPDHGVNGEGWPAAPMWASKYTIENYVRQVRFFFFAWTLQLASSEA